MPTNNFRLPEFIVSANGVVLTSVLDIEVQSNSFLGADRFRISVVLDAADYGVWIPDLIELVISVGLNGSWQELIRGPVDRVEVDTGAGLIYVDGRDLTARFIEARTQETFENQTASGVVEIIATRRGLSANVSPTTALVGRSYGGDHSQITLDQYAATTTEWDLLTKLASNEGFDVWVDGQTLNFAPPLDVSDPLIVRPSDCQSLHLDRSLALSAGLAVTVKSWDCRAHSAVSQLVNIGEGESSQNYIFVKPNLTAVQANDLARRILAQISQHARTLTLEWPGELSLKPRQALSLVESNTDFDGTYIITAVERRISFHHGFTETIQAKASPWITS